MKYIRKPILKLILVDLSKINDLCPTLSDNNYNNNIDFTV